MSEYPLSVTLKARSDSKWDAPWIVVYGNAPDEIATKLEAIRDGNLIDLLVETDNRLKLQASLGATSVPNQQAAPPQASGPWGGAPAQPQAAPQQQARPSHQNAVTHPEGLSCEACGAPLEKKITGSGGVAWRCPSWRWNNGNPNEHTQVWG